MAKRMRNHAFEEQARVDLKNRLAEGWDSGAALEKSGAKAVKRGEKLIDPAESDLKEGRALVDRGNRDIAEGRKLMEESERRFKEENPELDVQKGG